MREEEEGREERTREGEKVTGKRGKREGETVKGRGRDKERAREARQWKGR